ncbi:MAG: helix-turn-helix domain-containing protein [Spirosomataceae bacterium]
MNLILGFTDKLSEIMIQPENIAEKIRLTRIQKGLSQENMADMLSLSTTAYGDIERNKTELTILRLLRIAQVLDMDFKDLLGIESKNDAFLNLENEKLKIENEKLRLEINHLKDKFEKALLYEALRGMRQQQEQAERPKIGFQLTHN